MKNIVFVGGGLASTLALPIVIQHLELDARYVTCQLPNEHPDNYRLIECVERRFGITIEDIGLGKSPLDVFREQNFLGNSMFDNCSRVLKREQSYSFMKREYPDGANLFLGIGATEARRSIAIRENWQTMGYSCEFPLIERPYIGNTSLMALCEGLFGFIPELYKKGFKHSNCHGACIKAGTKQWRLLLNTYPDVYAQWEQCERDVRASTGKNIGILRKTKNGVKRYVTLEEFRVSEIPDEDEGESEHACNSCESM